MNPDSLAHAIEQFLSEPDPAVVMEDGAILFDMARARYSISTEHGKCVLHFWSEERNMVRRVVGMQEKNGLLQLSVLRFGQAKPTKLEIARNRDRRTPSAKSACRAAYQQRLQRALERHPSVMSIGRLTCSMDLERSFGPAYVRGLMKRGRSAFAVLGVNSQEPQPVIDGALTTAILWLNHSRENAGNALVEGLRLFVPPGSSAVVRERMANLDREAAKWELYEFDERDGAMEEIDTHDRGNLATRLVQCADEKRALERFAGPIAEIRSMCEETEVSVLSTSEIAFRLRGLEFAHARMVPQPGNFRTTSEIVFGVGSAEIKMDDNNASRCAELVHAISKARWSDAHRDNILWRLRPERWLESLVIQEVAAIDERLNSTQVYSQVPAFAASDRAMIDVLAITREGRLAVVELKAEEDIHLPLQGLDYWSRVSWHHARGEFTRFGYFPGRELSPEPPLLILVAPALHIHPATDTLLRYLSPDIEWTLVAVDEHWRHNLRPIFRKRPTDRNQQATYSRLPAAAGS